MNSFHDIVQKNEASILSNWLNEMTTTTPRGDLITEFQRKEQATELLRLFAAAVQRSNDVNGEAFAPAREFLKETARTRMSAGFTPSETAMFVLSLKQAVFDVLRDAYKNDPAKLVEEIWTAGTVLDKLAMFTVDFAMEFRDQVIARQQEDMLELSTPVVKLWEGVLALPLIGTLDSARTQVVMESLLSTIVETNSRIAIIDITGVPTVDTLVAQHLIKTITAARLMGAECYLSGIRPAIAQTIVHLGIDLTDITTKARLSDAFALALARQGKTVVATKASLGPKAEKAADNFSSQREA